MRTYYGLLLAVLVVLELQKLESVLFAQPIKVIVPQDKPGAYLALELAGGWLTESQDILVTYGYPTGLLTAGQQECIGVYTVRAPAAFVHDDDFTPEWQTPQRLVVHTRDHPDLVIDLPQRQLRTTVLQEKR